MQPELVEKLKNKKWYFQGFNATPALLYGPAFSMLQDMPDFLGFGYPSGCVMFFEHDVCYYLYAWDDLYAVRDELLTRYRADENYLHFLLESNEKICQETLTGYLEVEKIDWKTVASQELFRLWRQVNHLYCHLLSVSHIIEGFSLTTEEEIRERIQKEFPDDAQKMLLLLTTPEWHSFLSTEHYEVIKIVQQIQERNIISLTPEILQLHPDIAAQILTHQKKYFWKLNSYTSAKILDEHHFIKEINEFLVHTKDVNKMIEEYEMLETRLRQKEDVLQTLKDKKLVELLTISNVFFRIHDRRKEFMTQSVYYLDFLLREISKRFAVPLSTLRYIRESELEQLPDIETDLLKRRDKSVYIISKEGDAIEEDLLVGSEADTFFEQIREGMGIVETNELKGNCASPGLVTGTVKICRGEDEIQKMKKGDILVACMTQPEFVPAMKLASAVITDEGGLTCHAAIVSRELGIPCVIGTKFATTVFKDGDLVEVDANRGIVRKIT